MNEDQIKHLAGDILDYVDCNDDYSSYGIAAIISKHLPAPTVAARERAREIVDSCAVNLQRAPNDRIFITAAEETLVDRIAAALSSLAAPAPEEEQNAE